MSAFAIDPWSEADKRLEPVRLRVVHVYPGDKIDLTLVFKTKATADTPATVRDVSYSTFVTEIKAIGSSDAPLPTNDMTEAVNGKVVFRWTGEEAEELPSSFILAIAETAGIESIGDELFDDVEELFDEIEGTFESTAIWDRTIFLWPIVRSDRGR